MRKYLAVAVALSLVVGVVGIASAAQTQSISGKVTPRKLFKKKFSGVRLNVLTQTDDDTGVQPSPANRAIIDFDNDIRFFATGLAKCQPSRIQGQPAATARANCKAALVGTGNATAELGAGNEIPVIVSAFNGLPQGGKPTIYLHSDPGFDPQVLTGVLFARGAPGRDYAARLVVTIPPLGGGAASLTRFFTTVKKVFRFKGKRRHYVSARCRDKNRRLNFRGIFRFDSGQTLTALSSQRCVRKRRR